MDLKLENKKAFVSGSTQGIGYAIARKLLEEGTTVIINGRTAEKVNTAVNKLKQEFGDRVTGVAADFSKKEEVQRLIEQIPSVDILINNVGIFEPRPFAEISDEEWLKMFEVNVLSGVRLSRHYLPKMLEKNWGRVIFVSSESAINTPEEMIHYGATKTMQLAISRGMAELTKGSDVTVNTVLPGPTRSEGIEDFIGKLADDNGSTPEEVEKEFFKTARPTSLLQRFASVEEVAAMVVYLASPLASATNGAAVKADGGVVKSIF
jgi:NAD(P)-dependent dehydrogenase (short-subunit alcohol dehydrogenase family)